MDPSSTKLYFFNGLNFVTMFCRVLKMKITFINISSNPPPILSRNLLTNQYYQKKIRFLKTAYVPTYPDTPIQKAFHSQIFNHIGNEKQKSHKNITCSVRKTVLF